MKKIRPILLFFVICLLPIQLVTKANTTDNQPLIRSSIRYFIYFDTVIFIDVWDKTEYSSGTYEETTGEYDDLDPFWVGIEDIIKDIQYTFDRTAPEAGEPESELYRLNQSAGNGVPFVCSDDLYEVIKIGLRYAEITDGKFDPTIGPLVDLWDINNPYDSHPAPSQQEIDRLLPLVDYKLVETNDENKTVYLPKKGMVLDLGAIAKGYATDKIVEYIKSKNIQHAMINVGGNIYAYGQRHTKKADGTYNWGIGIQDPREDFGSEFGNLFLQSKTVVTSGIYERYIIDPNTNRFYHHIIDTTTGYPVENNLSSVTIITDSSTTADCFSTSVFALGLTEGINFVENYKDEDVEAVFVTKDLEVYVTSNVMSKYKFEIVNSDFKLMTSQTNLFLIIGASIGIIVVTGGAIYIGNKLIKNKLNK